jgi:hypothetical protein
MTWAIIQMVTFALQLAALVFHLHIRRRNRLLLGLAHQQVYLAKETLALAATACPVCGARKQLQ